MRFSDLAGKRIAIWGFGTEGRAALGLLQRHSTPASVIVMTDEPSSIVEAATGVAWEQTSRVDFSVVDVVIKSPGVSPLHETMRTEIIPRGIAVTGGTALWFAQTNGDHTIGVTGSKGKSTTSSITAHLLTSLGLRVVLAGNVGRALLDVLGEQLTADSPPKPDWYVLELSSFQCAEIQHSPEIGVLTALFPEHLDWHGSIEKYYADKCNLFAHRNDRAGVGVRVAANVDNPTVAERFASLPHATPYGAAGSGLLGSTAGGGTARGIFVVGTTVRDSDGTTLVDLGGSLLLGRHNAVNVAGALTALRLCGIDLQERRETLDQAIKTFRPLAHRLEPVGEHRGRLVIDDSLSTAPQAAVAALAAFADRPVGIIVGGYDRGLDYQPLADALAARTTPTWVCGVPLSGERIIPLIEAAMLREHTDTAIVHVEAFDDFDDAVRHASDVVPSGGVLLLSPAAPSFGRFRNYAERGQHFRSLLGLASPS